MSDSTEKTLDGTLPAARPKVVSGAGEASGKTQAAAAGSPAAAGKGAAFAKKVTSTVKAAATYEPSAVVDAAGAGRHARLKLSRINPWSVAKVSFLLSVAFGVVAFVAITVTWTMLGVTGVWDSINEVVGPIVSAADGTSQFDVRDYVGMGRVVGMSLLVSVLNCILLPALATLTAYLYNMGAALLGGVEVTLSEDNS